MGRDFGWPVVQAPAQSRLSSAITPVHSGLCPAGPLKTPRTETANLPGPQCHWLAALTSNTFLYVSTQSLSFQIMNVFTTTCNSCDYFPWSNRNVGRGVWFSSVTATNILWVCVFL